MIFGLTDEVESDTNQEKVRIDGKSKKKLLKDLKLMGISSASIYPGPERKAMELARKRVD